MHAKNQINLKTVKEIRAEEKLLQERVDERGVKWRMVYLGGGDGGAKEAVRLPEQAAYI
ncbi:MAG: hypothetical protein K0B01_13325 [Syntrophobacterales bacterium]|nr:hypothetical protein [Syntrophobacterales bacterium]